MYVEIIDRRVKGSKLFIAVEDEDGNEIHPLTDGNFHLEDSSGNILRVNYKPEYGRYFEVRGQGVFKDKLKVIW